MKTCFAALSVVVALAGLRHLQWREKQVELMRAAVIRDLVETQLSRTGDPICVCITEAHDAMAGGCTDPGARFLRGLSDVGRPLIPGSRCGDTEPYIVVHVGRPSWRASDFVTVEGAYLCGFLCGNGYVHTLSRTRGVWTVDTVRHLWVS